MDGISKAARVGQMIIGVVYIVAGAVKVWEPVLFYWEAIPYAQLLGVVEWETASAVAKAALVLGPIEFFLGWALLLNWQPRLCLPVATVLMAAFTALTAKAWHMGASIDCGCFGALVERGPGEAAIEDGAMVAVLLFAWWGMRRSANAAPVTGQPNWWGAGGAPVWPLTSRIVLGTLAVGLAVGGMRFFPELERIAQSDLKSGVRLSGLALKGVDVDLMQGEYLIELFSPTCGHCKNAVPKMNILAQDPQLPQLIALTSFAQDAPQLIDFKKQLQPRFDIATISVTDFRRLTFGHGYPRLAYVADGVVQQVWESNYMPTQARLRKITGS
ncbi:MAG: hypothetical protein J4F35_14255 [Candidatus Latescibacteria bacterium]|nr:hypothetical protein [Candidatus Latescibacterota bacterium]